MIIEFFFVLFYKLSTKNDIKIVKTMILFIRL